ncbi:MAG TPA: hypothetical protein VMR49_02730 [Candidatus Paceibacterota bacterium]|nr:hypothetical protein [Candidatus Paceibacterota bacterium]
MIYFHRQGKLFQYALYDCFRVGIEILVLDIKLGVDKMFKQVVPGYLGNTCNAIALDEFDE